MMPYKENMNSVGSIASEPLVSVCIANYNGLEVLHDCINSILNQDCDFRVEIIIHDDASTDSSLNLLKEYSNEVTVIPSTINVGFCISNNRMVERAKGKYILLLNNDAWLEPDALRVLAEHAVSQQQKGILGLEQIDARSGSFVDKGSRLDPFFNATPNMDRKQIQVAQVIGACLWIPRDLWTRLGGFPTWFGTLGEDLYLCCRARLEGFPVEALSKSHFHHLIGTSIGGGNTSGALRTSYWRRKLTERNKVFVMVICTPWLALPLLLPLHLLLLATEGLLLSLLKLDFAPWKKIYGPMFKEVWSERNRMWQERKEVQAKRSISTWKFFSLFTPMPFKLRMLLRKGLPEIS